MTSSSYPPDRRRTNFRDTAFWERDVNGYAVCPWCAAMVYSPRAAFHQEKCSAAPRERRGGQDDADD